MLRDSLHSAPRCASVSASLPSQCEAKLLQCCLPAPSELPKRNYIFMCVSSSSQRGCQKKKEKKEKRKKKAASRWIASEISSCYIIVLALKTKQNAPNDADRPCFSKHRGCGQRHPHHPTVCSFTPNHGDLLSFGLGIHNAPSSPELCA